MRKAIGLLTCTVMAGTTLWFVTGQQPARTVSAQIEDAGSVSDGGYDSAARRFLDEARALANKGDVAGAKRLAQTAARFPVKWNEGEVTPEEFLRSLDPTTRKPVARVQPRSTTVLPTNNGWQSEDGFVEPKPTPPVTNVMSDSNPFRSVDGSDGFFAPREQPKPAQRPVETTEQPGVAKARPVLSARKRQAMVLIRQARSALNAGKYREARARALQAKQMGATYGLFDDRPEHILAEIERQSQAPAGAAVAAQPPVDPRYKVAVALLREARHAIKTGDLSTAKTKADQAAQLGVQFPEFEDRPELVLTDIAAASQRPQPQPVDDSRQQALALLKQARTDLAAGAIDNAATAATRAAGLNATFETFDDRPELVLQEISRVREKAAAPKDTETRLKQALELLAESRRALKSGDPQSATRLATQADELDAVYGIYDDRPDLVMNEIQRVNGDAPTSPGTPVAATQVGTLPKVNALESYNQGLAHMRAGDRTSARHAFETAYRSGQKLDAHRQQQLEDFLRDLQPVKQAGNIRLTNAQFDEFDDDPNFDMDEPAQAPASDFEVAEDVTDVAPGATDVAPTFNDEQFTDAAADATLEPMPTVAETPNPFNQDGASVVGPAEQPIVADNAVVYNRYRIETLNAVFRADKLREKNPDQALEIIERAKSNVESANLDENAANTLLGYLDRSQESVKSWIEQRSPIIDMERRNRETKQEIEKEIAAKVRIEQEFAELVDDYNKLMNERRYLEAQTVAKQARELSPENPLSVTMVWKAQFAREHARNMDIKERKQQGFLDVLAAVDEASVPFDGEIEYPKDWDELTKRRRKYGQADNRTRSEQEIKIEESLNRQVSLHFEDTQLTEVVRHISTVANVNVVLDRRALEEEGVQTDELVSIDVDGIRLKSALNLLLEPYGLAYTIKDEVLQITSRMRQEGAYERRTYSVADLVVPVPNFTGNASQFFGGDVNQQSAPMTPGGNFNVPSGGLQVKPGGNALFQVDDSGGGIGTNPWLNSGASGTLGGGSSAVDFNSLVDLIMSTIEPGTWDEVGGEGAIKPVESTLSLVIRQTQKVHEEIRDLLEQLRRLQDLQVTVEVRFISVTDRFFERIGVDFDFNVQDNLGDPPGIPGFGSRQLTFLDGGGGGGGGGGGQGGGDLRGGGQGGQQQQQQGGGGLFDTITRVRPPLDDWASGGSAPVVGLSTPGQFTNDFDIQFNQGSFNIGVPDFGNFQPDAGISVGLAILSDIEAFFFIQAAQADERANILFAPKVTLFNGQSAFITDQVSRPFVVSVQPVVGNFSSGFQPIIQFIQDGISLFVQAVISADRRFVRLTLQPLFSNLVDVFTFTTIGGAGGGGQQGGGQGGGGFGGGQGGGGFGGGGQGGGQGGGGFGGGFGGIGGMTGLARNRLMETSVSQFGGQGGGGGGFGGGGGGQGGGGFGGQGGQGGQGGGGSVTLQQPVVEIISVSTTVSVPDGGTVLLGGIKRLREGRNMAGVPILNKIPYISRLFKNTGVGRETESVMMMVTPRIIIQEEEEELVTGSIR